MKTIIAALNKRGGEVASELIKVLEKVSAGKSGYFEVSTPLKHTTEGNYQQLHIQDINSPVAVGYATTTASAQNRLQVIQSNNATVLFNGTIYAPNAKTMVTKTFQSQVDYVKIRKFIEKAEGDFTFIFLETARMHVARDVMGVEPLYFGENDELAAVASNRRALWELGIPRQESFPPGHLADITYQGFKFEPIKTLKYTGPKALGMEEAAQTVQELLERSVQLRVAGLQVVAVAFSGGLDSSIIAHLAKKYCDNVQLMHVSLENQPETEEAWIAAEMLDLPMQVHLFKEKDVEETVPKVVELIEEADPLKVSVGVPFYWIAEKTAEAKLQVLLAGQGADELFGGYQRYVKEYLQNGDEQVSHTMFNDVAGIYKSNLERDVKICRFHDVQLRLPFASYKVAKFVTSLPAELKFENRTNSLRKLVLRKVAKNLGIPESIVQKPKKAVQYSTGINSVLKKLAKKRDKPLGNYLEDILEQNIVGKIGK